MKRIALPAAAAALVLAGCASAVRPDDRAMPMSAQYRLPGEERTFHVRYVATVESIPEGSGLLRLWIPVPQDSPAQEIRALAFETGFHWELRREPKYGNTMVIFEIPDPPATVTIPMTFTCTRQEIRTDFDAVAEDGVDAPGAHAAFLGDDSLVVVDERIRRIAADAVNGKPTTLGKARALYDSVVERMTYDKTQVGWGHGDSGFACDVGKGNCTDFHALFNALCRAEGIASGFEIGLFLPYDWDSQAELSGYHCWAAFRVPGRTWIPVDISEADKNPGMKDYLFGGQTPNRVTLSTGRDIVLEPPQSGGPLNYFIDPYAEVDGKPVKAAKSWTFSVLP